MKSFCTTCNYYDFEKVRSLYRNLCTHVYRGSVIPTAAVGLKIHIFVVANMSAKQTSVSRRVELVRYRNRSPRASGVKRGANVWKNILDDICDQCSLHGLNHIIRNDRSTGEKSVLRFLERIFFSYIISSLGDGLLAFITCTVNCINCLVR